MTHPTSFPVSGGNRELGRLLAYLGLGFLLGSFGARIPLFFLIPLLALVLLVHIFLSFPMLAKTRARALRIASLHPFSLGMASGLLPCGLLHFWLGIAVASQDPYLGAALLFILWLGTLPALEFGSTLLRIPLQKARQRFPKLVPTLLLLLALLPLLGRSMVLSHEQEEKTKQVELRCH